MPITQCNFHPFTFYLPFHTSSPVDQCPIYAPSNCTMGLDMYRPPLTFGAHGSYYTVILYSSCGLNKRPAATLAFLLSVSILPSQYLFQRGPIWVLFRSEGSTLTLPLFLLSPRIIMICDCSSTMTKDHFSQILYGTK